MTEAAPLRSEVIAADFFEAVGYATVWEDERVIDEGLAPRPGEAALSITSGGDFSLQLLLNDPASVLSLDFNPRQSHLLELKRAAAARLDHDELWRALGLAPAVPAARLDLYRRIRGELSPDAATYWDAHRPELRSGVLPAGKQDRYLHLVGRLLTRLQGRRRVDRWLTLRDPGEQRRFFERGWNGPAWRVLGDILFSRRVLDHFFHRDHFRYAKEDQHPGQVIRRQLEHVLRDLPAAENFYMHWVFRGGYADRERCPAWLRASSFERLRGNLDRLTIESGELEERLFAMPAESIDVFNFSNIFDWMSAEAFAQLMGEVVRVARPGARLCYWTNVVNTRRVLAETGIAPLQEDVELGRWLHDRARTPGYSHCTIGRVRK